MKETVLFDCDGVLLNSFEANLDVVQRTCRALNQPVITRDWYSSRFHLSLQDLVAEIVSINSKNEIAEIVQYVKKNVPYDTTKLSLMPHCEGVVKELQEKYVLGIVTSRIYDSVYKLPQLQPLLPLFSVIVTYEDTVAHKPDPAPLLYAAEKLSIAPEDCVYVGDADTDVVAAKAAGMDYVQFSSSPLAGVIHFTNDFQKIPSMIQKLVSSVR